MLSETKKGTTTGGGDMPPDLRKRAEDLIEIFEKRLENFVTISKIRSGFIRPLAPGSIVCGEINSIYYVGYFPQLGIPTLTFMSLTATGQPSALAFHRFLEDRTTQDFCVVELKGEWLDLPPQVQEATVDAVALQVIQSELSRTKVNTTMIPFNPIFGQNTYPIQDNLVFVLMPFEPGLTAVYNNIVKPAVESKGLVARRADDITSNNAIMNDIWKSICEARFIIADLSGRNPNVMYELGIAHTVGKETILIHQTGGDNKYPFDISHIRIIGYEDTAIGGAELRNKLNSTVDSVLQKLTGRSITY